RWLALALGTLMAASTVGAQAPGAGDWPAYGRDRGGERFSPLTGINRGNVSGLALAWEFSTGEAGLEAGNSISFEATPLVLLGVMYLSTPLGKVIALEAETGRKLWLTDLGVDRTRSFGDFTTRGVSLWSDPRAKARSVCARRIIAVTIDARLFALDAATGRRCAGFGEQGSVDLRRGLRNPPYETEEYEVTSPPAVVNGVVIVGSGVADNNRADAASGEVRGYDARTGALRWTWDPIPQDSADAAWPTWIGPRAHRTGAANVWSVIAADTARGLVFLPTSSASPDYFGGERLGENRYANSIVALRAATGKPVWHFQTVHHDLWDYDNASPPALTTVVRNGRRVPVVIQTTKTGMMYVLDRETGVPVFPAEERPVPKSEVPGEEAWPTQPFTAGIPPLSPHRWSADSAWGPTPADQVACREKMGTLRNEGIFTPPSLEGTLVVPSNIGGAHWGGVAVDPVRQLVVVPVNRIAAAVQLIPREEFVRRRNQPGYRLQGSQYTDMRGTPYVMRRELLFGPSGAPCTPPPFGTLVAIDLASGARKWEVPLGTIAPDAPAAAAAWGSPNLGGPIVTAGGLVFIAATLDRRIRAYDIETGKELWSAPLPAGGKATPMTFLGKSGKQYLVIAAGGDGGRFGKSDRVIAFALGN
ncbi:MAG TPA: pyrroloquinoline quinone-dependent dehydrogenase, partial [Gemmatimonadales bacterium]|nr:pyrroloquinoline quinone-dependent dehydrogenase [Gemmatimonadales bacterium]